MGLWINPKNNPHFFEQFYDAILKEKEPFTSSLIVYNQKKGFRLERKNEPRIVRCFRTVFLGHDYSLTKQTLLLHEIGQKKFVDRSSLQRLSENDKERLTNEFIATSK